MKIDLEAILDAHPALPPERAQDLALHAAVALEQQGHRPGAELVATVRDDRIEVEIAWRERSEGAAQLDAKHIVELGAEAVALGLAHAVCGWSVVRRLQAREHADWLVREAGSGRLIALEISGTSDGSLASRLQEKLAQVERSPLPDRAVCVVRFVQPEAVLLDGL